MRDVPYIIGIMAVIIGFSIVGTFFFLSDSEQDKAVSALNNLVRNSAIEHVDMTSRVDIGHMYINQNGPARIAEDPSADVNTDFESSVLANIGSTAPKGSVVRFDYVTRTGSSTLPVSVYSWDGTRWSVKADGNKRSWRSITSRESIEAIRVQYRNASNTSNSKTTDLDDSKYWTYQSTIELDRSDFVKEKMEAANPS